MPGLQLTQQDIEQFIAITQASHSDALHFLEAGTTLEGAIEDYYAAQTASAPAPSAIEADDPSFDQDLADDVNMSDPTPPTNTAGGPRTLSGEAAEPLPAGWGQPERSRFGRIQHNQDRGGGGHSDDEDDDDGKPEELYAGGRDSGLAVENPDKPKKTGNSLVDNILRMAKENGPSSPASGPSGSGGAGSRSAFRGTGNTLGSDEVPSTQVPDASSPRTRAPASRPPAPTGGRGGLPGIAAVSPSMMDNLIAGMFGGGGRGAAGPPAGYPTLDDQDSQEEDEDDSDESVASRNLTFWRNGFSIEDGPLLSYDDPANQELLKAIESGRAPLATFGVRYNQRLNVVVAQRRREDYVPPPKKPARSFGGSGNRLGSATPDIAGAGGSSNSAPVAIPAGILVGGGSSSAASTATGSAGGQTKFEVDDSKPTTNVQLRLGDGTRLVARVNLTHTVGDLRNYVSASRPDSRSFILQTTFPSRELSDVSETIEGAKLQNAVVVQRFT